MSRLASDHPAAQEDRCRGPVLHTRPRLHFLNTQCAELNHLTGVNSLKPQPIKCVLCCEQPHCRGRRATPPPQKEPPFWIRGHCMHGGQPGTQDPRVAQEGGQRLWALRTCSSSRLNSQYSRRVPLPLVRIPQPLIMMVPGCGRWMPWLGARLLPLRKPQACTSTPASVGT